MSHNGPPEMSAIQADETADVGIDEAQGQRLDGETAGDELGETQDPQLEEEKNWQFKQKRQFCIDLLDDPVNNFDKLLKDHGLTDDTDKAIRVFNQFIGGSDHSVAHLHEIIAEHENVIHSLGGGNERVRNGHGAAIGNGTYRAYGGNAG